jgi:hypothetical protein
MLQSPSDMPILSGYFAMSNSLMIRVEQVHDAILHVLAFSIPFFGFIYQTLELFMTLSQHSIRGILV